MDEDAELIELQYEDGDIEEIDYETWQELDLDLTDEPWRAGRAPTMTTTTMTTSMTTMSDDWDEDGDDDDDDDDDDEEDDGYGDPRRLLIPAPRQAFAPAGTRCALPGQEGGTPEGPPHESCNPSMTALVLAACVSSGPESQLGKEDKSKQRIQMTRTSDCVYQIHDRRLQPRSTTPTSCSYSMGQRKAYLTELEAPASTSGAGASLLPPSTATRTAGSAAIGRDAIAYRRMGMVENCRNPRHAAAFGRAPHRDSASAPPPPKPKRRTKPKPEEKPGDTKVAAGSPEWSAPLRSARAAQ